jgi:ethanolaminephosphotransferase
MGPKQREMDDIVSRLYSYLSKVDGRSLLVVLGDHGMTEQGNHGGSTEQETSSVSVQG